MPILHILTSLLIC